MIAEQAERDRILAQLQRRLRERLVPPLQALFDELDLRLFDLAERSRISAHQHAFFDGLRECRRKRSDIERDFLEAVASNLRPAIPASTLQVSSLSLVANDELEETMALSALAARTAARLAPALDALDRRLALLLNVMRLPSDSPRLAPQALGNAFRAACRPLDVGIEIRLVAYTLFGNHVLDALESIYAELNRELIAAGVLPAITPPPRRASTPTSTSHPTPRAPRAAAITRAPVAGLPSGPTHATGPLSAARQEYVGEPPAIHQLLRDLRLLLAAQHAASTIVPIVPTTSAANQVDTVLPPERVLAALDRLQHFDDEPRQLKAELLAASRRIGNDGRASLAARDENTVDLVGLVFDFVRHDPNLPEPMQPLIARLQVPFLKAALSDPDLLQAVDHPARQLIDELGELALGWTPSTDPEGQVLERIRQTVEVLMQPHEAGRAPFERAILELQSHLQLGRHRAELAEQRAVETALGRERLRIARSRVAAMLERRLSRYAPLPWIRQLLRGPWANYLVLLWLGQGESGESYRVAFEFVDELLWCDEHGNTSNDDARLRDDEEELEDDLRHGLSCVAYHDREIERLAGELRQFIASLRRHATAPAFLYEIDPKLGTADFSQQWAEHELEDQPASEEIDASLLARLRTLPPGTWFEFGANSHRSHERAKLSWSSPFTGRCLFVNRNGMRVDEIAPERLAEEIESGLTRILENSRLLQRALQTLLSQLRPQSPPQRTSA